MPITIQIASQGPHVVAVDQASQMAAAIVALTNSAARHAGGEQFDVEAAKRLAAELDRRVSGAESDPIVVADDALEILDRYLERAAEDDDSLKALAATVSQARERTTPGHD
jgi:hypothetical protein